MLIVASGSKEFAMTEGTEFVWFGKLTTGQGSFGFHEIGTVLSFTGGTPFAVTGMILVIVVVESSVTLVAEVGSVKEPLEGITSVVMFVFLDQSYNLVGGNRSSVDDHVGWVNGHDFDLVSGKCGLKLLQLGNTAGSFGNVRQSVKFFGFPLLDGASSFQIMVIWITGISVGIRQGFHGDDGPCTTQLVFVFDGDARLFGDTTYSGFAGFVAFTVTTTTTWSTDEGGLHGEGVVWSKFFVGIEFGCERLEILVESFAVFLEFAHSEGGGLEGVGEGP